MTLTEWFDQSCFMQLLIIWCVATYLFGWFALSFGIYLGMKSKVKNPFRWHRVLLLFFFAPVMVPYILWFE